jgi:hypothetical protein
MAYNHFMDVLEPVTVIGKVPEMVSSVLAGYFPQGKS